MLVLVIVYHYRDANGLECDAVIHKKDGHYGLVEIKIGGDTAIERAADTLLTLNNTIDTKKMNKPDFMAVLTAVGDYAYTRKDCVHVIPIGCLGP